MALSLAQKIHINYYIDLLFHKDYTEVIKDLRERKFTNKDIGISYRELNHWSTKEILFENNEKGKWRKFNILELVWIELIKEFRKYNLPLTTISKIKESITASLDIYALIDEDIAKEQIFDVMVKCLEDVEYGDEMINELKSNSDEMLKQFLSEVPSYNIFEIIMLESFFLKIQYRILVNLVGDVTFSNELYIPDTVISVFEKSNLSVSINSIISTVFKDYTMQELKLKWKLISKEEEKILDMVQSDKKIKSINIKFNKDSEISLLEYVEELKISPNDYLKKIILSGGYQDIKILTQEGNVVLCERIVKEKL